MNRDNPNQTPQLLSAKALAKMLSLSVRSVWRLRAGQKLPEPVKVGGAIRWRQADIERWAAMGCPDTKEFEMFRDMVAGGKK
ncbi:MAG: helix-turn-helix transcriptional regulator [Planctomycetota bacterium]|jgi:predicted DNA-binding transcriptional regulator AlpA